MARDTELAVKISGFKNNYWGSLICKQRWADGEHDGGKGTVVGWVHAEAIATDGYLLGSWG